jgi:OOP family OmpA-OmpF porin
VAASLVGNPQVRIEISGHTDSTGVRTRNIALSQARAQAVRAYLASQGVTPDRMVAKGYGPDRPVATNKTPAGRQQNRRVELNLIP